MKPETIVMCAGEAFTIASAFEADFKDCCGVGTLSKIVFHEALKECMRRERAMETMG